MLCLWFVCFSAPQAARPPERIDMLTIEALKQYGADTDQGLARCLNNEAFYTRLVGMALNDANFERLRASLDAGDAKEAFEAAHALKGSIGNLALTPIFDPLSELTEKLRGQDGLLDLGDLPGRVFEQLQRARELL